MRAGFAALMACGCACLGADGAAAQTYPSRPIHIVVSSSPGGVSKWNRLIRDANIKAG
jgi:tripartite-type tricarboxylate transporter receptor subunit TctC